MGRHNQGGTRSPRVFVGWALLVALALAAIDGRAARADDFGTALEKARRAYVSRLETVASHCDEQRIGGMRDRVFERILLCDPDHARARAVLRYTRASKTAPWTRDPAYRPATDWNKGAIPEAEKRLHDAEGRVRADVVAAIAEAGEGLVGGLRDEAVERLVDWAPDDEEARKLHGDIQVEGRWMLPETASAPARRKAIAAMAAAARKDSPPPGVEAGYVEVGWKFAFLVDAIVVYGSVDAREGRDLAGRLGVTRRFIARVIEREFDKEESDRLIVFPDQKRARAFLARDPAEQKTLRLADRFVSFSTAKGDFAICASTALDRRQGLVGYAVQMGLRERWSLERGWLSAGLRQRLTWHLEGLHGGSIVKVEETGEAEREFDVPMPDDDEDWLRAAAAAVDRGGVREFRALLTRSTNGMRSGDILAAYGLAAYLLEGRPESFIPFCQAAHKSTDADAIVKEALGVDIATLYWRVRRWLLEQGA